MSVVVVVVAAAAATAAAGVVLSESVNCQSLIFYKLLCPKSVIKNFCKSRCLPGLTTRITSPLLAISLRGLFLASAVSELHGHQHSL